MTRAHAHQARPFEGDFRQASINAAKPPSVADLGIRDELTTEEGDEGWNAKPSTGLHRHPPGLVRPEGMQNVEGTASVLAAQCCESTREERELPKAFDPSPAEGMNLGSKDGVAFPFVRIAQGDNADPMSLTETTDQARERRNAPVLFAGAETGKDHSYVHL